MLRTTNGVLAWSGREDNHQAPRGTVIIILCPSDPSVWFPDSERDGDRCGDRSTGAPQRDPGVERSQLSGRAGQEGGAETGGSHQPKQGGMTGSKHAWKCQAREIWTDPCQWGLYTMPREGKSNCRHQGKVIVANHVSPAPTFGDFRLRLVQQLAEAGSPNQRRAQRGMGSKTADEAIPTASKLLGVANGFSLRPCCLARVV